MEAKKIFSPLNCSAIRRPFVYEAWLGTSPGQFQAYWTKISDVSRSRSQAVELTNPSCMSRVTGGAELIQMVQYIVPLHVKTLFQTPVHVSVGSKMLLCIKF